MTRIMGKFVVSAITARYDEEIQIDVPAGANPQHFDIQRGVFCFWAEISTEKDWPMNKRTFRIFGTGQEIPAEWDYVGTCLQPPVGDYVWHLYENRRTTFGRTG